MAAAQETGDQEIGFCDVGGGRRVAVAVCGAGPPLVLPSWWVSNVEANWGQPRFRAFVAGLARRHRVIRYDRLGSGLSDARADGEPASFEAELATLEAVVEQTVPAERPVDLLGISYGGCLAVAYADRWPERARRLVTFGAYAHGAAVAPPEVRASLLAMVRAHWGLGARVLTQVWLPDAGEQERRELTAYQRSAADPGTAADLLELAYDADVRAACARLRLPTLVLHRREDRAAPLTCGRELAALIDGARLLPLDGGAHPPWHGRAAAVVEATLAFLAAGADDRPAAAPAAPAPSSAADASAPAGASTPFATPTPPDANPLTQREREILRLVARGLGDAQIAAVLVLSPHTVHRHVANIRRKLGRTTRAAAAAEATRRGLLDD